METGMLHLHNFLRWLIVLFAILTLIKGASGLNGKKAFTKADKRWSLFLMICADFQLLIGLFLYFTSAFGFKLFSQEGFGMSDKAPRFWAVEHALGMLIGIVLIHLGYSAAKNTRLPDAMRYKRMFWFTLIAVIVIVASVPWSFREPGIARPLFPGMH